MDDLINHPIILDGIVFRLIQMSEHMNGISEDYKFQHPEVKWVSIKGFRNKLVHEYGNVDLEFVFNAIKEDIPRLKEMLSKLI